MELNAACTDVACWHPDTYPSGTAVKQLDTALALVDNPQDRRLRRRPLLVSNPDQREKLNHVLNLISECERTSTGIPPCAPAANAVSPQPRNVVLPPSPCRRRRRRPTLVVSNPDEIPSPVNYSYPAVGEWIGVPEVQACS